MRDEPGQRSSDGRNSREGKVVSYQDVLPGNLFGYL
jgi:hypothetical protein